MEDRRIRVAVIGSGNIGTDLCFRILNDPRFELVAFVGRRSNSPGLELIGSSASNIVNNGMEGLLPFIQDLDGVFDASSAFDHPIHWDFVKSFNKWVIDLTPSKIGTPLVPELIGLVPSMKLSDTLSANYSMVTCGGQSSAPLVYALAKFSTGIEEVEVSSSIAALSAGPATRRNIDQYIDSTEALVSQVTNCINVKSILVLNPAEPPVMMRTTVQMKVDKIQIKDVIAEAKRVISKMAEYVPGYELIIDPYLSTQNQVSATVKVSGAGFYLPTYAGNLDIINAAAIKTALIHSEKFSKGKVLR
jgi:acetaldehyde dehydrogenase (acetylating)